MAHAERHLLIAYDGSPTAVRAAASLFRGARASVATVPSASTAHSGSAVPLLHGIAPAFDPEVFEALDAAARRQADETAGEAVEQARTHGLDAEPVTIPPSVPGWAALLDAAHELGAELLICGTRGCAAFVRAVLGSTSSSLLHNTDVPPLVVPDGGGALDGPVVVAYDGSDGARRAIEAVGRLLGGRATVVVRAWEPPFRRGLITLALAAGRIDDVGEVVVQLHAALAQCAAATTENGVAVAEAAGLEAVGDTFESDDGPWRGVAAAARAPGASVIAMGMRGLGAARSVLLGSVSAGLVQNAELPVLVAPGEPPPARTGDR